MAYALVSCNKENEEPEPEPQPSGAILPAVISYTYGGTATPDGLKSKTLKFEYDNQDRISKIHSEIFDNGVSRGFITTISLEYSETRLTVTHTRTDLSWADRYFYEISGTEINDSRHVSMKLNEDAHVLYYQRWDNHRVYEFTYDADGNATSIRGLQVATGEVKEDYALTPGKANGVFHNVKTPAWFITSQLGSGSLFDLVLGIDELAYMQLTNNCTRAEEVNGETVYEYDYTCNEDNYPTQIIRNPNFTGGEYVRYNIEYIKAE